jgi:arylsulfatase A-like enzyme
LRDHAREKPFFLQVESYDVHEPWDVPEPYRAMYGNPDLRHLYNIWPPYHYPDRFQRFMAATTAEELAFIRSQYAAKLTMVDRWLGELLQAVEELDLWDDTCIILASDHGHDIGEHGQLGKQYPHYDTHAQIPMFIWHPQFPGAGQSIDSLTQTVDIHATVLDVLAVSGSNAGHSHSLLPLIKGERLEGRNALLYGQFGQGICVTDGDWTLFKSPDKDGPLFQYSTTLYQSLLHKGNLMAPVDQGFFIPDVEFPQWKIPVSFPLWSRENFLFNRKDDPEQEHNLWADDPLQRRRMLDLARHLMQEEGSPPEQYERLGL